MRELVRRGIKAVRNPRLIWRRVIIIMPHILKVSRRVTVSKVGMLRTRYMKKKFENTEVARTCFEREMLADELFACYRWKPPVVEKGPLWFTRPFYPEKNRLDLIAPYLSEATRRKIAAELIFIFFDIFSAGYAHRDAHAKNIYWINGKLRLTDYEWLEAYPKGKRPAFPLCYDITGKGLESPGHTSNMCYSRDCDRSIQNILDVPVEHALDDFKKELKDRLRHACKTFATKNSRHVCSTRRIDASFQLPYFSVEVEEAERDSGARLRAFGVRRETVFGKTVLDLGCNIGGMLFEIKKYEPGTCVGVEYDADKVSLATQIAAYNGLENVTFMKANVDSLDTGFQNGPFDVVFCQDLEAHVKKREHLFRRLSQATRGILYFEGNSNCDLSMVELALKREGFVKVERLGFGKDDCIPGNDSRPMLCARKCF